MTTHFLTPEQLVEELVAKLRAGPSDGTMLNVAELLLDCDSVSKVQVGYEIEVPPPPPPVPLPPYLGVIQNLDDKLTKLLADPSQSLFDANHGANIQDIAIALVEELDRYYEKVRAREILIGEVVHALYEGAAAFDDEEDSVKEEHEARITLMADALEKWEQARG